MATAALSFHHLSSPPAASEASGGAPPLKLSTAGAPPLKLPGGVCRRSGGVAAAAVKRSGFLTTIDRAIEEEEYRRARAEVQRKGVDVEGHLIEGISMSGHETCVVVPSLNAAFDIGRCPAKAVHQDFLFITHGHLDHISETSTVFVPPCIKEDVEKLLDVHRAMSQDELKLDLVPLDVGETYEIRNDLVVRPFRTNHTIPSQGYVVYSVRNKLKKQYAHLKGTQIRKLKLSGAEITDVILYPEVAFTGDTTSDFILEPRNSDALRAKILITEATFLDDECNVEHARRHGHMHLSEIMEYAQWFRNKAILLTNFSSRYKIEDIREAVSKLQPKVSAKVTALTEGFRSTYT
ncbi:unnamed protein product [Spirodela intermedia]|uniref:Metallo-beta-lactamase domain-containing protein n=1 Tax=Spirodela intermedia TaxID=51605 RepID=A0A7I8JJ39_SPIIN|nr:unnamed protein product [Spirodela intermedia]CAA6670149.1 unnamed protein product [Spirodela intermedia]